MAKPFFIAIALASCICHAASSQSPGCYTVAGTYTKAELARMVQSGIVKNNTLVWENGMAVWAAAETVAELQVLFPPDAAPSSAAADQLPDKASLPLASPSALPQGTGVLRIDPGYYALLNGPFDGDTLIKMVQSGELAESSVVWLPEIAHWALAGTVAALRPFFKDKTPEKRFHLGLGIEATGYSREGIAPGATASAGFSFMPVLMAGITVGYFNNLGGLSTMEAGAFLRGSINEKKITLFAQGEGGIAFFLEDTRMKNSYFAGGKLGVLINLNKVKLGPYAGGGVPYLFSGGILLSF
jgi:hypothetical protein